MHQPTTMESSIWDLLAEVISCLHIWNVRILAKHCWEALHIFRRLSIPYPLTCRYLASFAVYLTHLTNITSNHFILLQISRTSVGWVSTFNPLRLTFILRGYHPRLSSSWASGLLMLLDPMVQDQRSVELFRECGEGAPMSLNSKQFKNQPISFSTDHVDPAGYP
jgi:hypothetical protein